MSDQASYATQASESDFHDSHPLSKNMSQHSFASTPSIGDLTDVNTDTKSKAKKSKTIGDIANIDTDQKSELLSDISLLDEAFAELDEVDGTSDTQFSPSEQSNSDIPVLNEAISAPSESRIITMENTSSSIPLLDQEATVFLEAAKSKADKLTTTADPFPASSVTAIDELSSITENPETIAPSSEVNESIASNFDSTLETPDELPGNTEELETIAPLSTTSESTASNFDSTLEIPEELLSASVNSVSQNLSDSTNPTEENSSITSFDQSAPIVAEVSQSITNDDAALEALLDDELETPEYNDPNIASSISNLSLDIESVIDVNTISIDEKIASASGKNDSEINIELPLTTESSNSDFSSSVAEDLSNESLVDSSITDESETEQSEISKFNPAVDLDSQAITHATHQVEIMGQEEKSENNFNLNIPFELHSQLSKKIDELVIDATASITDELQCQLISRLESLLGNAVESVLPKLVNQMAGELRNDVNQSIKQQLPHIINEVLNKTRLHS